MGGSNLCPLQEALLPRWDGHAGPTGQAGCPEHASPLQGCPYLLQSHLSSSHATEPAAGSLPAAFPPTPVSSALGRVCSGETQGRKGAALAVSRALGSSKAVLRGRHHHQHSPTARGSPTCSSCSSRAPRSLSARSPSRTWQATSPLYRSSDSSVVRSMIWGSNGESVWASPCTPAWGGPAIAHQPECPDCSHLAAACA